MTKREHHLAIAGFIFFVVLILAMLPAHSRDDGRYAGSPNKAWFDSLTSRMGPCCSDADGTALADVDWDSKDGHYRVRIDGQWWDVPEAAVLQQPNRDGRTIAWPVISNDIPKRIIIRCFIIGAQV